MLVAKGQSRFSPRGVGDFGPNQINAIASTGASTTVSLLAALSPTLVTGPIGAAAMALIAVGSLVASMFKGCGQTCVVASQDADKFGALAQQNMQAYFSAPAPRPMSLQSAALNNFDTLMAALRQACSDPALGAAGQRCISERLVKGGTAPWCPTKTGCDWITTMRDPIANDPTVPDPSPAVSSPNPLSAAASLIPAGFNWSGLLIPAGLLGLGLVLVSGDSK